MKRVRGSPGRVGGRPCRESRWKRQGWVLSAAMPPAPRHRPSCCWCLPSSSLAGGSRCPRWAWGCCSTPSVRGSSRGQGGNGREPVARDPGSQPSRHHLEAACHLPGVPWQPLPSWCPACPPWSLTMVRSLSLPEAPQVGGDQQAPHGFLPPSPKGLPRQKGTIMGTLRSLGALARAVGPMVAASGKGPGIAFQARLCPWEARPGGGHAALPSAFPCRPVGSCRGPAIPGVEAQRGGRARVTSRAVSPQCTGWPGPGSASRCAQASSCSLSCSCAT